MTVDYDGGQGQKRTSESTNWYVLDSDITLAEIHRHWMAANLTSTLLYRHLFTTS